MLIHPSPASTTSAGEKKWRTAAVWVSGQPGGVSEDTALLTKKAAGKPSASKATSVADEPGHGRR